MLLERCYWYRLKFSGVAKTTRATHWSICGWPLQDRAASVPRSQFWRVFWVLVRPLCWITSWRTHGSWNRRLSWIEQVQPVHTQKSQDLKLSLQRRWFRHNGAGAEGEENCSHWKWAGSWKDLRSSFNSHVAMSLLNKSTLSQSQVSCHVYTPRFGEVSIDDMLLKKDVLLS